MGEYIKPQIIQENDRDINKTPKEELDSLELEKTKELTEEQKATIAYIKNYLEDKEMIEAIQLKNRLAKKIDLNKNEDYKKMIKQVLNNILVDKKDYKRVIEIKNSELASNIDLTSEIQEEFVRNLRQGEIYYAVEIKNELAPNIDLAKIEGFEDSLKQGFINSLKYGYSDRAIKIKNSELASNIDLTKIEGFEDSLKQGFIEILKKGDIDDIIKIKNEFAPDMDLTKLEGFESALKKGFSKYLRQGFTDYFIKIKNSDLAQGIDLTKIEDFEDLVKEKFIDNLRFGSADSALKIRDNLAQGIDLTKIEGFESALRLGFIRNLKEGDIDNIIKIKNEFAPEMDLTKLEGFESALKEGLNNCLIKEQVDRVIKIKNSEFASSVDLTSEIEKLLIENLKKGNFSRVNKVKDNELALGTHLTKIKGFESALKEGFIIYLKNGWIDNVIEIKNSELAQGIDLTKIEGFEDFIKQGFVCRLQDGDINRAIKIKNSEFVSNIDLTSEIKKEFIDCWKGGRIKNAIDVVIKIKNSDLAQGIDLTKIEGFESVLKEGFIKNLRNGRIDNVIKIKNEFAPNIDLTKLDGFESALKQGFINRLSGGKIEQAIQIKNELAPNIDLTSEIRKGFIDCWKDGLIYRAIQIKNELAPNIDLTKIEGFEDSLKQGFIKILKNGWMIDSAVEIKNELAPNMDLTSEMIKKFKEHLYYDSKEIQVAVKIKDKLASNIDLTSEIKGEFVNCLNNGKFVKAIEIKDKLASNIDLTSEIRKGFSKFLDGGKIIKAIEIKKFFASNIDLASEIEKSFSRSLETGFAEYAIEIKNSELAQGINLDENINLDNYNYPKNITFGDLEKIYNINQIGEKLLKSIKGLHNFDYNKQIKAIMNAQGDSAFLYFNTVKGIKNYQNLSAENVDYLVYIAKKYNTQARNILKNIILKLKNENFIEEKNTLDKFLKDVGITDINIYNEFKSAVENNDKEKVREIKENVNGIKNAIYEGNVTENMESNSLFEAVQYYVFPPALGLDQEQYNRLNKERPDRRNDVPKELESLQYKEFEVGTGHFELGENENLNLDIWSVLSEVIKEKNKKFETEDIKKIDLDKISLTIIDIYYDKNKRLRQKELFEIMYEYHLSIDGGKLETGFDISQVGLMKYKEFIGDRIKNDLVKKSLEYVKENNIEKYNKVKKDILNRLKGTEDAEFNKLNAMYNSVSKVKDEKEKERLKKEFNDLAKHFGLNYDLVNKFGSLEKFKRHINSVDIAIFEDDENIYKHDREDYYNSPEFQKALEIYLDKYDEDRIITKTIGSGLVGDINKNMRKEIDKFKFSKAEGGEKKQKLTSVFSKKREHGVVGHNMGICITTDKELWDNPNYILQILFNPETKQAMGGMNLLIVGEDLTLPGINPSMDILANTNNEELYDEMIKIAKEIKEKLNLNRLLIPTEGVIHSNRQQIQDIIRNKNYKRENLEKMVQFSYNPYKYSFKECFIVS